MKQTSLRTLGALIVAACTMSPTLDAAVLTLQEGAINPLTGQTYTGTEDTMLASNTWTMAFGSRQNVQIGATYGTYSITNRGLLRFDVSSLAGIVLQQGESIRIDSVTLRLYLDPTVGVGTTAYTNTLQVFSLSAANSGWVEGVDENPATGGQSTWKYLNQTSSLTGTTWAGSNGAGTAGTDYINTVLANYDFDNTARPEYIDLTLSAELVEGWLTGENAGLLFKTTTETSAGLDMRLAFLSSNTATQSKRPILSIEYTVIPEPSAMALAAVGLMTVCFARRGKRRTAA